MSLSCREPNVSLASTANARNELKADISFRARWGRGRGVDPLSSGLRIHGGERAGERGCATTRQSLSRFSVAKAKHVKRGIAGSAHPCLGKALLDYVDALEHRA